MASQIEVDQYLAHHGILGMRWGKHKVEERTAYRNNSAQKYTDKANTTQKQINALGTRHGYYVNGQRRDLIKVRDQAIKDAQKKQQGKLTDKQRKLVIGTAVVGTIIAAAVIYSAADRGEFNRLAAKGKAALTKQDASAWKKNLSLADKNMSVEDITQKVVSKVNPGYGAIGTKMNCRRATFAYELRRRGLDVKATRTLEGGGQTAGSILNAISPGRKLEPTTTPGVIAKFVRDKAQYASGKTPAPSNLVTMMEKGKGLGRHLISNIDEGHGQEKIFEALSKQPTGSRGELGVTWAIGGGHSMAWEIIKGKPVVFDAQSGKVFTKATDLYTALPDIANAGFTRLDNLKLNNDFLLKWVKNA